VGGIDGEEGEESAGAAGVEGLSLPDAVRSLSAASHPVAAAVSAHRRFVRAFAHASSVIHRTNANQRADDSLDEPGEAEVQSAVRAFLLAPKVAEEVVQVTSTTEFPVRVENTPGSVSFAMFSGSAPVPDNLREVKDQLAVEQLQRIGEECQAVTAFVESVLHSVTVGPANANDDLTDEWLNVVRLETERLTLHPVHDELFACARRAAADRCDKYNTAAASLATAVPGHLGIRRDFWLLESPEPYAKAISIFRLLPRCETGMEKAECLIKTQYALRAEVDEYWSERERTSRGFRIGGDDLLPILSYIALKSALQDAPAHMDLAELLLAPRLRVEREGYAVTTFQTVVDYVSNLDEDQLESNLIEIAADLETVPGRVEVDRVPATHAVARSESVSGSGRVSESEDESEPFVASPTVPTTPREEGEVEPAAHAPTKQVHAAPPTLAALPPPVQSSAHAASGGVDLSPRGSAYPPPVEMAARGLSPRGSTVDNHYAETASEWSEASTSRAGSRVAGNARNRSSPPSSVPRLPPKSATARMLLERAREKRAEAEAAKAAAAKAAAAAAAAVAVESSDEDEGDDDDEDEGATEAKGAVSDDHSSSSVSSSSAPSEPSLYDAAPAIPPTMSPLELRAFLADELGDVDADDDEVPEAREFPTFNLDELRRLRETGSLDAAAEIDQGNDARARAELVESEVRLLALLDHVRHAYAEADMGLSGAQHAALFGDLDDLVTASLKLQALLAAAPAGATLGEALPDFASWYLKPYLRYVRRYPAATEVLATVATRPSVVRTERAAIQRNVGTALASLGLADLLIAPVQRLPRLVLLFKGAHELDLAEQVHQVLLHQAI